MQVYIGKTNSRYVNRQNKENDKIGNASNIKADTGKKTSKQFMENSKENKIIYTELPMFGENGEVLVPTKYGFKPLYAKDALKDKEQEKMSNVSDIKADTDKNSKGNKIVYTELPMFGENGEVLVPTKDGFKPLYEKEVLKNKEAQVSKNTLEPYNDKKLFNYTSSEMLNFNSNISKIMAKNNTLEAQNNYKSTQYKKIVEPKAETLIPNEKLLLENKLKTINEFLDKHNVLTIHQDIKDFNNILDILNFCKQDFVNKNILIKKLEKYRKESKKEAIHSKQSYKNSLQITFELSLLNGEMLPQKVIADIIKKNTFYIDNKHPKHKQSIDRQIRNFSVLLKSKNLLLNKIIKTLQKKFSLESKIQELSKTI